MISHTSDDTKNSIQDTAKWLPDVPPTGYDNWTEDTVSEQTMQLINSNPSGSTAEH